MAESKAEQKQITDYTKLNIYQKMAIATSKIEKVIKGLTVKTGDNRSYKAVSDKDVNNAVKPVEAELGIYSYPFDREITSEDREIFKTKNGQLSNYVIKLKTVYRFVNVDNPSEFIDIKTYGYGIDSQDKAPGKAMTYSDKYALLKAYKIETGDDPDAKSSEDVEVEINEEYAKNYKLTFGKYKGKTIEEIKNTDESYLEWLYTNEKTEQHIKDCIKFLYDIRKKELTQVEEKEVLDLMQQMRELADDTNTNYEELLRYYKVDSNTNMTLEQLKDCVKNLNLKKRKIEMLRQSGQEVE